MDLKVDSVKSFHTQAIMAWNWRNDFALASF